MGVGGGSWTYINGSSQVGQGCLDLGDAALDGGQLSADQRWCRQGGDREERLGDDSALHIDGWWLGGGGWVLRVSGTYATIQCLLEQVLINSGEGEVVMEMRGLVVVELSDDG